MSPLPPNNDPTTPDDAGDGFLMRHGYTLVWSGFYGDVTHSEDANALTIDLPIARNADGSAIEQEIWEECNFSQAAIGSSRCSLSYPVPRMEKSEASLFVRERRSDAPVELPRESWIFSGKSAIELLPAGKLFEPGLIYQFAHRASNPPVMGVGLAAIRDIVSFLRNTPKDSAGIPNPLFSRIKSTLMMGWSQSGRMVREFLYRGFNRDELKPKTKVFSGVMAMGAATRPFVNYRFAQPVRAPDKQHGTLFYPDSSFPFAYEVQDDPLSKKTDGILKNCLSSRTCPKVFHVVTSNEYWHYKNSQVTTDTLGLQDGKLPSNVRAYLMAGMSHAPYAVNAPGVSEQPPNEIRFTYLLRNLLTRLNEWSGSGTFPPPNSIPKIADKTLVSISKLKWPKIPNVTFAGPVLTRHHLIDYGPDFLKGIVKTFPEELPTEYPPLVPQVDSDGNDIAGIRHPAVSVPLATRVGWSILNGKYAKGEMASQDGSMIVFARNKLERLKSGDPRLSIEERYQNLNEYKQLVVHQANGLVRRGYLLSEDVPKIVDQTIQEWPKLNSP